MRGNSTREAAVADQDATSATNKHRFYTCRGSMPCILHRQEFYPLIEVTLPVCMPRHQPHGSVSARDDKKVCLWRVQQYAYFLWFLCCTPPHATLPIHASPAYHSVHVTKGEATPRSAGGQTSVTMRSGSLNSPTPCRC